MSKKLPIIDVKYDPGLCDWDKQIAIALKAHGMKPGDAHVMATPYKRDENQMSLFAAATVKKPKFEWEN